MRIVFLRETGNKLLHPAVGLSIDPLISLVHSPLLFFPSPFDLGTEVNRSGFPISHSSFTFFSLFSSSLAFPISFGEGNQISSLHSIPFFSLPPNSFFPSLFHLVKEIEAYSLSTSSPSLFPISSSRSLPILVVPFPI